METRKRGSKSVFFRRKTSCLVRVTILPQLCHDPASVVSRLHDFSCFHHWDTQVGGPSVSQSFWPL